MARYRWPRRSVVFATTGTILLSALLLSSCAPAAPPPPDPAAVAAIGGLCEANARLATSFGDLVRRSPRGQVTEENRDARIGYLREALDGVRAARSSFTTATPGPPVVNNVRISYVR